jgi:pseudoazurin
LRLNYRLHTHKGKQMKKLLSTVAVMVALSTPAFAADTTVEMLNKRDDGAKMVYSQDITRIDVNDTITWVPTSKGHNVEFIAGPDGWDAPRKSKNNKEVAITFDTPGVYVYQCSPHKSMGMIGIVVVGDGDNDVSKAKVRGKSKKKLKALLEQL